MKRRRPILRRRKRLERKARNKIAFQETGAWIRRQFYFDSSRAVDALNRLSLPSLSMPVLPDEMHQRAKFRRRRRIGRAEHGSRISIDDHDLVVLAVRDLRAFCRDRSLCAGSRDQPGERVVFASRKLCLVQNHRLRQAGNAGSPATVGCQFRVHRVLPSGSLVRLKSSFPV